MSREVEIASLDLRYRNHRLKNRVREGRLLSSIAERGIDEPLEGITSNETHILLNGFKRYRCACRLGIAIVPYISIGEDETAGITALLSRSKTKELNILEQSAFVDDLKNLKNFSVAEIAELLSRSKAWVSMRAGLIDEMTDQVRQKLFSGAFSTYAYMIILRKFMRMNAASQREGTEFMVALSGKKLSVREIRQLANGFFRGPDSFRKQIKAGNIALSLKQIREIPADPEGCSAFERGLLKDLEITSRYIQRVMGKSNDSRLQSRSFNVEANLLSAAVLSRSVAFIQTIRRLHDKTGQA